MRHEAGSVEEEAFNESLFRAFLGYAECTLGMTGYLI
jgi:hypothetical protein